MKFNDTRRCSNAGIVMALAAALLSVSCSTTAPVGRQYCANDRILVDARFEGGNFFSCTASNTNAIEIDIRPEDPPPINPSPWYAFRLSPAQKTTAVVTLKFHDGYARYWPKISADRRHWTRVDESAVHMLDGNLSMQLALELNEGPLYVAGQELVTGEYYLDWLHELAERSDVTVKAVAQSVQGRPIFAAKTAGDREAVLLLGRQHPPEITGGLAMRSFVQTVLGDSALARRFRERYAVIVIPLINPDGVAAGHWRHNVNGVDLNRDWGPFSQPEIRGIAKHLAELETAGTSLKLMFDFHSTRINTFYTQLPSESTYPFDFATVWLQRARTRVPDFDFKHDARSPSGQANSKNYFFKTYGIPAITYELGDETGRDLIATTTPVFAEEMMRTMLELPVAY